MFDQVGPFVDGKNHLTQNPSRNVDDAMWFSMHLHEYNIIWRLNLYTVNNAIKSTQT